MNYFIQWLIRLIKRDMEWFSQEAEEDKAVYKAVAERLKEEKGKKKEERKK